MGLKREDSEPQVERRDENQASRKRLIQKGLWPRKTVDEEQWERAECEKNPEVEIQGEVAHIIVPRLYAEEVRPLVAVTEDVVENNVQWNADEFPVEEGVYCRLDSLEERVRDESETSDRLGKGEPARRSNDLAAPSSSCLKTTKDGSKKNAESTRSTTKGNTRAPANGQPNKVPQANQKIPRAALEPARE